MRLASYRSRCARRGVHRKQLHAESLEQRNLLTITVDTLVDELDGSIADGDVSLRDAIAAAPVGETIDFSVTGTINLDPALGQLTIDQDQIIDGPGANQLTIDAQGNSRVLQIAYGTVEIHGLTLTGGNAENQGGAIRVESGSLFLEEISVTGNSSATQGGGIANLAGALTIINDSIVSENMALVGGGGIDNSLYGTLEINASTISNNSAVGGGGIRNDYSDLTINNSTIAGNSAGSGGGILSSTSPMGTETTTISNSTISGNTAGAGEGGGVYLLYGHAVIEHSTITDNAASGLGDGIYSRYGMQTRTDVRSTIIAGNVGGEDVASGFSQNSFRSLDHNLIGGGNATSGGGNTTDAFQELADQVIGISDPGLLPLAPRGGPTQTHALESGSPAVDAGDPGIVGASANDQRGAPFVRIFNGIIDIGAVERQPAPFPLIVDTLVDEDDGDYSPEDLSLREAIAVANGSAVAETISFDVGLSGGVITLGGTELWIAAEMTLDGLGADKLTVDADDSSRVFNIDDGTAREVPVTIRGMTIRGGNETVGAGILNDESLVLEGSAVSGNSALYNGGGIHSSRNPVTLTDSMVSGNSAGQRDMFTGQGGGIFSREEQVTLTDSTVSGNSARIGGGIFSRGGQVTLTDSTVSGNNADLGGGLWGDESQAMLTESTISGNNAGYYGGGILSRFGQVTLTSSTVGGNSAGDGGGGIYSHGTDSVTLTESTVSGNNAGRYGGGIFSRIGSQITLTSSTVGGNSAGDDGGGILSRLSQVTLSDSTVSGNSAGNDGGGIFSSRYPVRLTDNTVNGNNTGPHGGGIRSGLGTLTLTNSTVSGNSAVDDGGGIFNFAGVITIQYSTVTQNQAGTSGDGVSSYGDSDTRIEVRSSIIAGNGGGQDLQHNSDSSFVSLDYNLVGGGNGTVAFNGGGDQVLGASDPGLGALADNGGPTQTHALLSSSPAIDTGNPSAAGGVGDVPLSDQRGAGFTRVFNGRIDIGAVEVQPPPATCDFDGDGGCDIDDIDALVAAIVAGTNAPLFDLTGDSLIDLMDRDQWLVDAGAMNLPSVNAYLLGDANLDGRVDGQDFISWNQNKWTYTGTWSQGDFNADGQTDGQDFVIWNMFKFQESDHESALRTEWVGTA